MSTLVMLTLRGLVNRRRTLLLGLLGALLVLIAALYRLSDPAAGEAATFTAELLADFGLAVLLPLVAVIVGTAALGSELEEGTIVYLLARPVARWRIVVAKLLVAWTLVSVLVAIPVLLAGLVGHPGDASPAIGYAGASVLGAAEYCAIFVALSLLTSRSLIIGLAYVVVWEGVISGLFAGTRMLSVRQHALAVAEELGGPAAVVAELDTGVALVLMVLVTAAGCGLAVRLLSGVELRGETT